MEIRRAPEREQLGKDARRFAERRIAPVAAEHDATETYPEEIVRDAAERGFSGWQIGTEYGGPGYSLVDVISLYEELFAVDPGIAWTIISTGFGSESIEKFGSEWQKQRYLPPVAAGDAVIGLAISEPGSGADAASIETRATKEDDEWVIEGEKGWVTNGSVCDYLVVLCLSDPGLEGRYNGFSQIIVEADDAGVDRERIDGKSCIRAADMAHVTLDGVRVPEDRLVGERGLGFIQQMQFFNMTRTTLAAQAVGMTRGSADESISFVESQERFGQPVSDFQSVRHEIAEMYTELEVIRLLTYWAARATADDRADATKLASMAKYFAAQTAGDVTERAVQLQGSGSLRRDSRVERLHRDVKITQIYEGHQKLQKNIIADELL